MKTQAELRAISVLSNFPNDRIVKRRNTLSFFFFVSVIKDFFFIYVEGAFLKYLRGINCKFHVVL